jgi:hypothetical protein
MSQARTVTASFSAPVVLFALTLTNGSGNGTGSVTGGGINCAVNLVAGTGTGTQSGTCTQNLASGTAVTLTAAAAAGGFTFVTWGGACAAAGAVATCNVTMSQARAVTAKFNAPSLATVQTQLFTASCLTSGCHAAELNNATNSRNYMVGVATTTRGGFPQATTTPTRIVAYNAAQSYVIFQVEKAAGAFGMPTGANPAVPANIILLLTNWINGGALAVNP